MAIERRRREQDLATKSRRPSDGSSSLERNSTAAALGGPGRQPRGFRSLAISSMPVDRTRRSGRPPSHTFDSPLSKMDDNPSYQEPNSLPMLAPDAQRGLGTLKGLFTSSTPGSGLGRLSRTSSAHSQGATANAPDHAPESHSVVINLGDSGQLPNSPPIAGGLGYTSMLPPVAPIQEDRTLSDAGALLGVPPRTSQGPPEGTPPTVPE